MKKSLLHLACVVLLVNSSAFALKKFAIEPLSPAYKKQLTQQGLWEPNCPVPLSRLRDVNISYYDFAGKPHTNGHIIVLDAVAKDVLGIFKTLYSQKFPIQQIRPTSDFGGNDQKSMAANNSSSFNCRSVTNHETIMNIHAYGLAIDINTVQNPFISVGTKTHRTSVSPEKGLQFMNRNDRRPGMSESIVKIFKKHGFTVWGGNWKTPIDYQHFQTSRFIANLLAAMSPEDARSFFVLSKEYPLLTSARAKDSDKFISLYQRSPKRFLAILKSLVPKH